MRRGEEQGRVVLHARSHVLVGGHREGGCGVTEPLAHDLEGHAGLEQQCGVGLAKVV
jgi:hypothetical protein